MFHYIKGVITERMPGKVCIENSGIGYEVFVPDNCSALFDTGAETVTLYTAMAVREDSVSLYGFGDRESIDMFNLLQTVQGVGAKAAMAVLSVLRPKELKKAIAFDDTASLQRAVGVGKKTAQRIVMELKDKIGTFEGIYGGEEVSLQGEVSGNREQAVAALVALGFSRTEALSSLLGISGEDLSVQDYIKLALRNRG